MLTVDERFGPQKGKVMSLDYKSSILFPLFHTVTILQTTFIFLSHKNWYHFANITVSKCIILEHELWYRNYEAVLLLYR